jgi:hypothetical protein
MFKTQATLPSPQVSKWWRINRNTGTHVQPPCFVPWQQFWNNYNPGKVFILCWMECFKIYFSLRENTLLLTNTFVFTYLFLFINFSGTGAWSQNFMLPKQALYCLSHNSSSLCSSYFGDGFLWTICQGWPWTMILLISFS